jgi:cell division protein ZapA
MGREFTVSCTDEERPGLINAVNFLDKKMRDIRDGGKIIGVERIAIMAALNLAHELLNTKSGSVDVGDIKRRISQMQDQIDSVCASK